jgi:predicted kinase
MTTIHVTTGLPASGKSSFARTLNVLRFSLDDYRAMMGIGKDSWTQEREDVAVSAMIESARMAIVRGYDVCLDNTHLVPRLPKLYRKNFLRPGVEFVVHDFTNVTVDECIARDALRGDASVGEDVIRKLAARLEDARRNGWRLTDRWMNGDAPPVPEPYERQLGLPDIVICDLDGTTAINDGHRGHYEYEKVGADKPNWPVLGLVRTVLDSGIEVVFMSGREDRCRDATLEWLTTHLTLRCAPRLLMRTTGDHRPDDIIKRELFDEHIRGRSNVWFCLDDRDRVVRLWRSMGLTCLQVAEGNF